MLLILLNGSLRFMIAISLSVNLQTIGLPLEPI